MSPNQKTAKTYGSTLLFKLEFQFRTKELGSRPIVVLTTPLRNNALRNRENQTLQSQADMLKLFLPDVGPMPTATDWASKTDEELAQAVTALGHEPGENIVTNIRKLVRLERQELFTWMSHVAANHGRNHSDIALLMPVIMRRVKMGTEQIEMVRKRWVDEKMREMGESRAVGIQMLEWAEATLRAALGDPATAATAAATIESAEREIETSDHESI
ncbi:hypothetical protein DL95DRAFT_413639 [Leptodontidium sp. 2 PMI_412]|nr:hypothetical protein DL95DRAFT_413639 [Leptodontidium sp. 2 PMI_412]